MPLDCALPVLLLLHLLSLQNKNRLHISCACYLFFPSRRAWMCTAEVYLQQPPPAPALSMACTRDPSARS